MNEFVKKWRMEPKSSSKFRNRPSNARHYPLKIQTRRLKCLKLATGTAFRNLRMNFEAFDNRSGISV